MLNLFNLFFSTYKFEQPPEPVPQNVTVSPNLNDNISTGTTNIDASELL